MDSETRMIIGGVLSLIRRHDVDPDITLLAKAVAHLLKQTGQLHDTDLDAFEQIEELDRRQGPGDT